MSEIEDDKNFKYFICKDCDLTFSVPIEESNGYYNWNCPKCGFIAKSTKTINFIGFKNKVKSEKIKDFTVEKPSLNYLSKEYGDELNKPIDYFKKNK